MAETFSVTAKLTWRGSIIARLLSRGVDGGLAAGAELIGSIAKGLAPVDTGRLRDSIHVTRFAARHYHVGPDVMGAGAEAPYDVYQEFGTFRMAAHPYMRPAISIASPQIRTELVRRGRVAISR